MSLFPNNEKFLLELNTHFAYIGGVDNVYKGVKCAAINFVDPTNNIDRTIALKVGWKVQDVSDFTNTLDEFIKKHKNTDFFVIRGCIWGINEQKWSEYSKDFGTWIPKSVPTIIDECL